MGRQAHGRLLLMASAEAAKAAEGAWRTLLETLPRRGGLFQEWLERCGGGFPLGSVAAIRDACHTDTCRQ